VREARPPHVESPHSGWNAGRGTLAQYDDLTSDTSIPIGMESDGEILGPLSSSTQQLVGRRHIRCVAVLEVEHPGFQVAAGSPLRTRAELSRPHQLARGRQCGAELVPIFGAGAGTEPLDSGERRAKLAEHRCVRRPGRRAH